MRYNVASQLTQLAEALGPEYTRTELTPDFVRLLRDSEAEVRVAAAGKVSSFSKFLTPPLIISQVRPRVELGARWGWEGGGGGGLSRWAAEGWGGGRGRAKSFAQLQRACSGAVRGPQC